MNDEQTTNELVNTVPDAIKTLYKSGNGSSIAVDTAGVAAAASNGTLSQDIDKVIASLHRRIKMLEAFKATL